MSQSNQYKIYIFSPKWRLKSKKCQQLTKNHCIVFPWLKSNHCHHLHYRNLKREIPVRDTVALSKFAHNLVHLGIFWKSPLRPWINLILRFLMIFYIVLFFIVPVKLKIK